MRRLLLALPPPVLPLVVLAADLVVVVARWATGRTTPLGGALVIGLGALVAGILWRALRDLHATERQARLLAPDHERLSLLARQTTNAVVMTDVARRITWVNAGFERLTGWSAAEVVGQSPGRLLQCDESDAATVARMRKALDHAEPVSCEIVNRARNGRLYWVDIHLQPMLDPQGGLQGFIAIEADITERKAAELALRESRAVLDRTARIARVGGWTWESGPRGLQWTDDGICRMLGYLPGQQPTPGDFLDSLDRDARAALDRALAQPLAHDTQWSMRVRIRNSEGRHLWVAVQAEAECDELGRLRLVGTLQDLSPMLELQAEVQRNAELLRGAIDAIDEGFVLYDPQDRLVFCNERYREMYTLSADLLQPGARFEDIIREGVRRGQYAAAVGREEEWIAQRLAAHRQGDRTLVQRLPGGRVVRIRERSTPDGHQVGFRIDITDLVRATEAAERADRAKGEFIATISHELRTPLQSILGFSDLGRHFSRGVAPFEAMFEDIHAGGGRMLRLVNGLLDVSKLDGSHGSLVLRRADLAPLLVEVVRELEPLAADRRLEIRLPRPLPTLPADVDAYRIQQVLRNVLANAVRFSPHGEAIVIEAADLGPQGVCISVRDRGPGIPPEEFETVFEPFVQSSRTRNGSGGTGLGLTISRKIVQAHGGHIEALPPADGTGAWLRLTLPPAEPAPETVEPTTQTAPRTPHKRREATGDPRDALQPQTVPAENLPNRA
jgi:hypothetical protein